MSVTSLLGGEWFDHILARHKPEPVEDFRDVLARRSAAREIEREQLLCDFNDDIPARFRQAQGDGR